MLHFGLRPMPARLLIFDPDRRQTTCGMTALLGAEGDPPLQRPDHRPYRPGIGPYVLLFADKPGTHSNDARRFCIRLDAVDARARSVAPLQRRKPGYFGVRLV